MRIASSMLDLIGQTPLVQLRTIIAEKPVCKAEIIAKLEYYNPGGSVKDRLAWGLVKNAEIAGLLNPHTEPKGMIIESTSGNTGIGLALLAAVRGYRLLLTMPESMSEERKALLRGLGAELVLTSAQGGMSEALEEAARLADEHEGAVLLQQFSNPAGPRVHEQTTAEEIWHDCSGKVDCIVAGIGTGATITGLARRLKVYNPHIIVCGVEPVESAVLSGKPAGPHLIQGIGAGFVPAVLDQSLLDEVIAVSGENALLMAKRLMIQEGIFAGISTGAAAYAALLLGRRPSFSTKRIVFIACDTADRYLSTLLFR